MNIIASIESMGLLFAVVAFVVIILYGKSRLGSEVYIFLFVTVSILVLHHFITIFQWLTMNQLLDRWGDTIKILMPVCWIITAHSWLQMKVRASSNEKDRMIETSKNILSETERRLSSFMFTASGTVYRCRNDRDWTMEFISDQCVKLTGYNPDKLINNAELSYADLIHPDDRDSVWQAVQEALDSKEPFILNYRIHTSSGRIRRVWEQGMGVWAPSGELVALEGFIQDVTPIHELTKRVEYHKTYDPVTKLLNRRAFEDRLSQAIELVKQENATHGLCLLDLDRFSVVNESCGVLAGNELLRQKGKLIHKILRKGDAVARLGGDKYAVLLVNCPPEKVFQIIEKLRKEIAHFAFTWHEKQFFVTTSCGVLIINDVNETNDQLIQRADEYCRVAKELGRNRICHSGQEEVKEKITRRHDRIVGLDLVNHAFENNQFHLFYQPIVPIAEPNDRLHFEVLIRMIVDDGIVIPPASFIPSVEQYGLAEKLDSWVFDTLLNWLENNKQILPKLQHCSINLSGQSIGHHRLLEYILDRIKMSSVPVQCINFEITETAAMENLTEAIHFIKKLKDLGCTFALDDFGSGMSSFAYLKNLPVDFLKIDGQFVRNIANNEIDYESVVAINRIGKVAGKKTIAEFVENEEIHRLLQQIGVGYGQGNYYDRPNSLEEMGIDYCQGYYFGKPKPLGELVA